MSLRFFRGRTGGAYSMSELLSARKAFAAGFGGDCALLPSRFVGDRLGAGDGDPRGSSRRPFGGGGAASSSVLRHRSITSCAGGILEGDRRPWV